MNKYYVGTYEELLEINNIICANSGIPDGEGTEIWAVPVETAQEGVYCLPVPSEGWGELTYTDMTIGVTKEESSDIELKPEIYEG